MNRVMDLFEEIAKLRKLRERCALATVIGRRGSTPAKLTARMLVREEGTILGTVGGGCLEADTIRAAREVLDTGRPRILEFRLVGEAAERTGVACGGIVTIMVESLAEPWVILVGAGHVGQAVAPLAKNVGFRLTIVDDRPDFASAERFPSADELIVADLNELGAKVHVSAETHIRIMTRGHAEDLTVLRWALTTKVRSIGVLGSRSKRIQFLQTLRAEGVPDAVAEAVQMPIGKDIGAESVPEIAVAIVAELIERRRRAGAAHAP